MALFSVNNVKIKGISATVPEEVYSNKNYEWISKKERDMLIKTTGVNERHVAKFGMTTADLCESATEKLIEELNWAKEHIDVLIFVSQSRDYLIPATACILQNKLGLSNNCLAFDVNMGCSGYVYGLSIISGMMSSGQIKKGLLLVGDISTLNTSYNDKSTYPLFGDAGTCTALEYSNEAKMSFNLQTDGAGYEAIIIRDGGCRNYASKESFDKVKYSEGIERNRVQLELQGVDVFNFSLKEVKPNVSRILHEYGVHMDEVDYVVFHQANKLINESIRKKLKLPLEKVPYSLDRYGNTSSASIPLTIVSELKEKVSKGKNKLLISGFGVGLSWGSALIDLEDLVCPDIIEIKLN